MDCEVVIKVPRKIWHVLRRKQGFRFDMYWWCEYYSDNQIVNNGKVETDNNLIIRNVLYFAALSYDRKYGNKVKYKKHTIDYWISKTYKDDLTPVYETMRKADLLGKTIDDYQNEMKTNAEDEKKKTQYSQ